MNQEQIFSSADKQRLNFLFFKNQKNHQLNQYFAKLADYRQQVIEEKITNLVLSGQMRKDVAQSLGFHVIFDEKQPEWNRQKWLLNEDSPIKAAINQGYTGTELQKFLFDDQHRFGINLNAFPQYKLLNEFDNVNLKKEFAQTFAELNRFEKTALRKDKSSKILNLLQSEAGKIQLSHVNILIASHFEGIVPQSYQEQLNTIKAEYQKRGVHFVTEEMRQRVFRNWISDPDNFKMVLNNSAISPYIDYQQIKQQVLNVLIEQLEAQKPQGDLKQEQLIQQNNALIAAQQKLQEQFNDDQTFLQVLRNNETAWTTFYDILFNEKQFQTYALKPDLLDEQANWNFADVLEQSGIQAQLKTDFAMNHQFFNDQMTQRKFLTKEQLNIISSTNNQHQDFRNKLYRIYDAFNTTRPRNATEKAQAEYYNQKYGQVVKNPDFLDADELIAEMATSYAELCDGAEVKYTVPNLDEIVLQEKLNQEELLAANEAGAFGSYFFKPFGDQESMWEQYLSLHDQMVQYTLDNVETADLLLVFETFEILKTEDRVVFESLKKKHASGQPWNQEEKRVYDALVKVFVREGLLDPYNQHSYQNLQALYLGEYSKDSQGFYRRVKPIQFKMQTARGPVEFELNVRDDLPKTNSLTWFKENLQSKQDKLAIYGAVLQNVYEDEIAGKKEYQETQANLKAQFQDYFRRSQEFARVRYVTYFLTHRLVANRNAAIGGLVFFPGLMPLLLLAAPLMCFLDRMVVKKIHQRKDAKMQAELEAIKEKHFHSENLWNKINQVLDKDNPEKLRINHLTFEATKNTKKLDWETFLPDFQSGQDLLVFENLYHLRNAEDIQNTKKKTLYRQLIETDDVGFATLEANKSDYPDLTLSAARDLTDKIRSLNFTTLPANTFKDKAGYEMFWQIMSQPVDERQTTFFLNDIFNLEELEKHLRQAGMLEHQNNFNHVIQQINTVAGLKTFFTNKSDLKSQTIKTTWTNEKLQIDPDALQQMSGLTTTELERLINNTLPDFMYQAWNGAQIPGAQIKDADDNVKVIGEKYQMRFDYNEYYFKTKIYYETLRKEFSNKAFGGFSNDYLEQLDRKIANLTNHNQLWNQYADLIAQNDQAQPIDWFSKENEKILEMLSQTTSSLFSKDNPEHYQDQSFLESYLHIAKEEQGTPFNDQESWFANYLDAACISRFKINEATFAVFMQKYNKSAKNPIGWDDFTTYMNQMLNHSWMRQFQKQMVKPMGQGYFQKLTNHYDKSEMSGFRADSNVQNYNEKMNQAAQQISQNEIEQIIYEQGKKDIPDWLKVEDEVEQIIAQKIHQNKR